MYNVQCTMHIVQFPVILLSSVLFNSKYFDECSVCLIPKRTPFMFASPIVESLQTERGRDHSCSCPYNAQVIMIFSTSGDNDKGSHHPYFKILMVPFHLS